jgi:hypothetical protein
MASQSEKGLPTVPACVYSGGGVESEQQAEHPNLSLKEETQDDEKRTPTNPRGSSRIDP